MIRPFHPSDLADIKRLHEKSGLPPGCLPDLSSPLFFVKLVNEVRGRVHAMASIKLIGEGYILLDHEQGTPQERWDELAHLIPHGLAAAADMGVDSVSAWIPPSLAPAFGKRLVDLGFQRSPWPSYSVIL